jgi:tRNA(Arg) A34 adenosine deaminase TadA
MRLVIRLARANVQADLGGPFAAAVFASETGALVSAGVNSVMRLQNSVLHAEVMALMLAHARKGTFTLKQPGAPAYELVTSCEPCAMCLGAVLWSGVRRLVYGASRVDAVGIGFDEGPVFADSYRYLIARGIEIVPEVLRAEAAEVLTLYRQLGGPVY